MWIGDHVGRLMNPAGSVPRRSNRMSVRLPTSTPKAAAGSPMKDLAGKMTELYGKNGKGGAVAKAQDTIAQEVKRKAGLLKKTSDPFFGVLATKDTKMNYPKFCSLGKIVSTFIGLPIAATKQYDDIQFIFYSINDKASYMAGTNLASFPIDVDDFELMFVKGFSE